MFFNFSKRSLKWLPATLLAVASLWGLMVLRPVAIESSPLPETTVSEISSDNTVTRLAAMGDFGSGLPGQMQVARVLNDSYQAEPFSHWLLLGDLIYPVGDIQKYGQSRFLTPYKPVLSGGVTLVTALGNHDIPTKNGLDAVRFFKMPAKYYVREVGPWADAFVIDSNDFNGVQARWLDNALAKSTKPWRLVMGHHPAFSSGDHGNSAHLVKTLVPILERHAAKWPTGAVWYLSGHDHDYERFSPKNGVHYVISGGGGASIRSFPNVKDGSGSLIRKATLHFLRINLTASTLDLRAIDGQSQIIDQAHVTLSIPVATTR